MISKKNKRASLLMQLKVVVDTLKKEEEKYYSIEDCLKELKEIIRVIEKV